MYWIIGIAIGIIVGYLLDREIYFYEGVRLGPRVQAWLYDRWARKYDAGKRESQQRDSEMLARPLLDKLKGLPGPFILDFATGTGRLSYALLNQPDFTGRIVALDLSLGMLELAAAKIAGRVDAGGVVSRSEARIGYDSIKGGHIGPPLLLLLQHVEFLRHLSLPLPFPDATFDAVCALEALELFPTMDEPMKELTRVLKPGGVMLTSRGTEASGRRAKVKSSAVFTSMLEANGLHDIQIAPWWKFFDRVFAVKSGSLPRAGGGTAKRLSAALRCGRCKQVEWKVDAEAWTCRSCGKTLSVTRSGVVLN